MKAIFPQFCAKKHVRQTATPSLQIQKFIQYQPSLKYLPKTWIGPDCPLKDIRAKMF